MATDPVYPEAVEPDEFWEEHKAKIITYAILFLLILGGGGFYQWQTISKRTAANALYAVANGEEGLKAVVDQYPTSVAAADALLELGNLQREKGEHEQAATTLKELIAKHPKYPLLSGAWLSLAATYELQGKPVEAFDAYQQVATRFPNDYGAPIALLSQARLRVTEGKNDDAIRLYQEIETRFPQSRFAREANQEIKLLRN